MFYQSRQKIANYPDHIATNFIKNRSIENISTYGIRNRIL